MASHGTIYGSAAWYDLAFSYRDYVAECDFLLEIARRLLRRPPRTVLEIAAGPANHSIELARRGLEVTALDRNAGMVGYGREKARREGVELDYVYGDMRHCDLARRFDMAVCMLVSWSYLLDNESVLAHLDCLADHLEDGGIYVIELEHPRDLLTNDRSTLNEWEVEKDGRKVGVTWGQPDDPFDPLTQVTDVTVEMRVEDEDGKRTLWEVSPQRAFTPNEIHALVKACGRFRLVEVYGALDASIPLDNEKAAWRMVPVLQKVR